MPAKLKKERQSTSNHNPSRQHIENSPALRSEIQLCSVKRLSVFSAQQSSENTKREMIKKVNNPCWIHANCNYALLMVNISLACPKKDSQPAATFRWFTVKQVTVGPPLFTPNEIQKFGDSDCTKEYVRPTSYNKCLAYSFGPIAMLTRLKPNRRSFPTHGAILNEN